MNKCIFENWLSGYDATHPDEGFLKGTGLKNLKAIKAFADAYKECGPKRTPDETSRCCCELFEAAEQAVTSACMNTRCGKYKADEWGPLFNIKGMSKDLQDFLKERFGVDLPNFTGDYNKFDDRLAYGNKVCCSGLKGPGFPKDRIKKLFPD